MAQPELHDVQQHLLLGRGQTTHRALDIEPQVGRITQRYWWVGRIIANVVRRRRPFATGLKKTAIGNAVEPGGKAGFAAKLIQFAPCQQECFLRQIVGPGLVAIQQAAQLRADHALMAPHKLFERASILRQQHPGHQHLIDLLCAGRVSHACRLAG